MEHHVHVIDGIGMEDPSEPASVPEHLLPAAVERLDKEIRLRMFQSAIDDRGDGNA